MGKSIFKIFITGDGSAAIKELDKVGDASDQTSGRMGNIGKTAAVVGLAVAAGAVAAGRALYEIGETFDAAFDKIRIGTGATGEELAGLEQSFKNVFASGPAAADDVSTAIANLNTRLGLTGKPLEEMSTQLLNLSRITETDVAANIETTTRLFGDWSVATGDQTNALDMMFRASQATGPSVDRLAGMMVQFGAPLREMGFSIEEAAAMLGKFEKEGVNTELVLGGMKMGLGRMIKEGKDGPAEFAKLAQSIAEVGLTAENQTAVFEMFGTRAGIDMGKALEEGRFSFDELVDTIANGGDTINQAAADTASFSEKWETLKNKTFVALEPVATKLFDSMGTGMDRLSEEYVPRFMDGMDKLGRGMRVIRDEVGPWVDNFKLGWANLVADWDRTVARFKDGWDKISTFFSNFKADWDKTVTNFGNGISRIAKFFSDLKGDFNAGVDVIKNAVNSVVDFITGIPGRIANVGRAIASAIGDGFKSAWNTVADSVNNAVPDKISLPFGRSIDLPANPLPKFHNGGRAGTEQVALLQAGEVVYTAAQNRAGMAPGGGGPSITVNINGPVGDPSEAGRQIVAVVERYLDGGGSARFAA